MKKVLVIVGIIISAVIISGIIVGLGKNEKTLFNEKIETDNNVLISIDKTDNFILCVNQLLIKIIT